MRVLLLIGLSLLGGGEILPGGYGGASWEPSGGAAGPAGGSSSGSLSSSGYGFGPGSGSELDPSSVGESPSPVSCVGGGVLSPGVSLCSAGGMLESFMLESFRLAILGIKLPFTCGESSLY